MAVEIRVPTLGESITEATVGTWFKKAGETVKVDEPLVELETEKVTVEVPAPASGVLGDILAENGETVEIGALLGNLTDDGAQAAPTAKTAPKKADGGAKADSPTKKAEAPAKSKPKSSKPPAKDKPKAASKSADDMPPSPAARKALKEAGLDKADVSGSGKRGQVLKHDVAESRQAEQQSQPQSRSEESETEATRTGSQLVAPEQKMRLPSTVDEAAREERVKMTRLRQTIAHRLKDAQNNAAILTTFNDADMGAIMELRSQYKEMFERRHGVKLGFMGFFVKACIQALKEIPAVNAEIDGDEIVYKNYYHIGVAVGTDRGLVVPVLREAEHMTIAEIEARINDYGRRAREGKLGIDDMQGGTFTISNGGVYGSMLSTPILNAPQSGILGMHRIEERAVVRDGEVVARPMMYLALSYDHRIVDGKEAVTFLVRVKECLEDPQRFILEL
jgi:2-oxoglutarate dehydrogenase E2 component (dihydrolipoamide succinyltransferase)